MESRPVQRKYDQQEISNREHDDDLAVKKVMPYGWDGSNAVAIKTSATGEVVITGEITTTAEGAKATKDEIIGDYAYSAKADPGSAESDPVWQVSRDYLVSPYTTTWADGNDNYDNVVTDFTDLTYS